ncbi:hypothetical protein [Dyadobacter beijingensis]|uniref:hypothetical protein n=1 Tax=Dyadobacter beijingensis TaxID=365489 RepID=UPI000378F437|nr:hypothetical protein [Dyadobacter beijingensis]
MEQAKKEELQQDLWRFIIIGSFLYSMFYTTLENIVASDRLPFRYFVIAGVAAFVVEAVLYFWIRSWPGRWKTAMVWLTGVLWVGVCLFVGR